ncbi:unnamed protein product [Ectocarpus sp. 4 AP-2014]|uniref:EsV-1-2 n=1 Tax=Ectocarpus siliculosus virus 1 (isolate New Zealand/Kaikoura/1988) TaxID=654926 RepID=Q8QNQ7_ESV1K|nr:EsV-1-2 [Ectocarpus siliculosus virus 1]AAK14428.1 EsV-1-2 [Ectocarpus siliculosus virus 1]
MKSPMEIDLPVSTVLGYMPNKYLDLATVSKLFSANYAPTVTQIDKDTSLNNMVEYFENGMPVSEHPPFRASELGRLDLFELAVEHGCVISHGTVEVAARCGHLRIIEYIWYVGSLCPHCACTGASMGGQLDVLKWLFPGDKWFPDQLDTSRLLVRNAVVGGFLPVVKWAHEKGQELDSALLGTAAVHGHFELVKYIHFKGLREYSIAAILHAALRGDLRTVKWLREQGYPWSDGICMLLARRGHLQALKYVRDHGCPWGMLKIGSVGHVIDEHMRTYLVDAQCPL